MTDPESLLKRYPEVKPSDFPRGPIPEFLFGIDVPDPRRPPDYGDPEPFDMRHPTWNTMTTDSTVDDNHAMRWMIGALVVGALLIAAYVIWSAGYHHGLDEARSAAWSLFQNSGLAR